MVKAKRLAIVVLAVLAAIVILQNVRSVETRILFVTVTMPQAILLLLTVALGFALGVLAALVLTKKQKGGE